MYNKKLFPSSKSQHIIFVVVQSFVFVHAHFIFQDCNKKKTSLNIIFG